MHFTNTLTEYGLISKLLHWVSAILLFAQIPLGFYLVDLDFGPERLNYRRYTCSSWFIYILLGNFKITL